MLDDILPFVGFLQEFRKVERIIYYPGSDRQENDAEHAYQLAMVAWYIIEKKDLSLDVWKVMKYALVHDLVEIYAWDTIPFDHNSIEVKTKNIREQEALDRIKKEFPEVHEIWSRMDWYELKKDAEAKFVYALDKILPIINTMIDDWRAWKTFDVSSADLLKHMQKTTWDNDIYSISQEIALLLKEHPEWFGDR